ncbi:MAG TPA: VCBS repeat-containing protein, partial [Gemmataceae bacterium]|nr:VCBS repeat-containing protein [Gemmataceae bacterium]
YQPFTLLENVGRVADVRAADFRGIGKLDLIVGVFGWRNNGEIMYLENRTTDWSHPVFAPRVVDDHHGTIHVPVCDLNGDGKPDFVALISQEHEMIVAFVNDGHGHFERQIVYRAPHPAYGSSGIQIVDLNGDGKPDILYSNGDIMDPPPLYKPYHGIQWLENKGGLHFTHHPIEPMYGAMRAVAAKAGGKHDLFAVSWLPVERFPDRQMVQPDAILWLENTGTNHYVRHALEQVACDHLTCATGDVFGDGRTCLVTGNYYLDARHPAASAVDIWKGPARHDAKPGKR